MPTDFLDSSNDESIIVRTFCKSSRLTSMLFREVVGVFELKFGQIKEGVVQPYSYNRARAGEYRCGLWKMVVPPMTKTKIVAKIDFRNRLFGMIRLMDDAAFSVIGYWSRIVMGKTMSRLEPVS